VTGDQLSDGPTARITFPTKYTKDEMPSNVRFTIDPAKWLLLYSVLNEVLHGFALDNFDVTIGKSKQELREFFKHLSGVSEEATIELDLGMITALHNALRETITELGVEEFHTRTGYSLEEGENLLRELNGMIDGGWRTD
jgi:hypothetical protein